MYVLLAAGAALLILAGYWRDWARLYRLPRLSPPEPPPAPAPLVSVLVPARNEERAVGRCVAAALSQSYPACEVIVVDDGSTDRTPAILAGMGDARLRVLRGRPLPPGWVGKCNACQQLGEAARGEWLLFLDADTAPSADLVAALLTHARRRGLDLVTILPFLELETFWERAVLPPFLSLIADLFPFERLERPDARPDEVMANGQCILVRRAAYEAIGGHAAVRDEVLEDVRLAQAIRRAGFRVGGGEGLAYLRVRMYTNGREVVAGLTKNAAAGYRSGGGRSLAAALRLLALAYGPLCLLGWGVALQIVLALLVLKVPIVNQAFNAAKAGVVSFISFSDKGAEFVFGNVEEFGEISVGKAVFLCAHEECVRKITVRALQYLFFEFHKLLHLLDEPGLDVRSLEQRVNGRSLAQRFIHDKLPFARGI
ncbi:MAG: glycosyltransferase, partial [Chloroflexales bacterium]|nr:glycosyltransferase [Chloroflexales bacterium]